MENSNMVNTKYHTHISSKHNIFNLNLKEVWKYRDLIVLFTKRSFKVTYKQTILGPAWLFINPILSSLIYCIVFGQIAGLSTDGVPQMLFYLAGNAIWMFFSSCVTVNATTFTANAGVFGKVYFPRLTMPISSVLSSVVQFGIQMILVLILLAFYVIIGEVNPNWWAFLLLPVILVVLGMMGLGVGILISSMTTKYRDLAILVTFGMQLWMYITPVVYPLSQTGGIFRYLMMVNPVTSLVELFRYAILGVGIINPFAITWSVVFTVLVLIFGIMIFNKVEKTFMDTV